MRQPASRGDHTGFTLVELAIVLVIIGLLAGGVLAGLSLVRGSEVRSVATDFTRYTTAIQNFRTKYSALPGDMKNAYSYWGAAAGCTNAVAITFGNTGCNGNGDGIITPWYTEGMRAWWMLASAGLIEGGYPASAIGFTAVPGTNEPASKIGNSGYLVFTDQFSNNLAWGTYGDYGNWISLGGYTSAGGTPGDGVLRPEDTLNLDTKLDDGMPGSGHFMAGDGLISGMTYEVRCVTARSSTGTYDTSIKAPTCFIGYEMP